MDFRVLGPLRVTCDGSDMFLPSAPKQRLTLAILLAHAGHWVSTEALIAALWAGDEPASARRNLHQYVHRLRGALGPDRLPGRAGGYRVLVDSCLDSARFEEGVRAGRAALATAGPHQAGTALRAALDLWRGPAAYPEFRDCDVTAHEGERLDRLRLDAYEWWVGARLDAGAARDVLPELTELVRAHQYRESLREYLMLALHRSGRRADALAEFHHAREQLREQLGVEPGPGLQQLYLRIVRGDEDAAVPAAEPPVRIMPAPAARGYQASPPALLPADVADFTGRADHLGTLDTLLRPGRTAGISTIDGAAGVGKTALAVHWSHQVRDEFPDGQLFLDLRGYAGVAPSRPIDALTRLLFALGVPADQVPDNLDDATGLYRTLLADRRMLLVLDNARTVEQVRPLVPGAGASVILVTSREPLTALVARDGARRVMLDPLTPGEARALLASVLGGARIGREAAAAADLVELCARLPLALRIAAAYLLGNPAQSVAGYVQQIRASPLTVLDLPDAYELGVSAAFEFSYGALPAETRRMYCLLGGVPGPDVGAAGAAALAGIPVDAAHRQLRQLTRVHLLRELTPGRYSAHDLLAAYARDVAARDLPATDRAAGLRRLTDWYLVTAGAAVTRLYPDVVRLPAPDAGPAFTDDADALAYLRDEEPNLIAAIHHAAGQGPPLSAAWRLADALRAYLSQRGSSLAWREVARVALAAATAAGDPAGQAASHMGLAHEAMVSNRLPDARHHYEQAVVLTEAAGWTAAQAAIFNNLGVVHARTGELDQALDSHRRALEIHRRIGNLAGVAVNLGNLGGVHHRLGRLEEAAQAMTEALESHRTGNAPAGQAIQLNNLGVVYRELGRLAQARAYGEEALEIYRELGSAVGQGMALRDLAETYRACGQPEIALEHAEQALAIPQLTAHAEHQAMSLHAIGQAHASLARHDTAIDHYDRALAIARTTGDPELEAEILVSLAVACTERGDHDRAAPLADMAVRIADRMRFGVLRGEARSTRAAVHLTQDEPAAAIALATEALAIHDGTGHRSGRVRALRLLVEAHSRDGDTETADRYRARLDPADTP
jgi:DNA-binding SARP family transcriptional activator/tetratricopeptide (TPR) repeat protein